MFGRALGYLRQQHLGALALFIALGGTSWALATGSINSREIKNNTVRSKDIRNSSVRGKDIRNGTVRGRDVGTNTLTGRDVKERTLGRVPSATTASSARSADNAGLLGGLGSGAFARSAQFGSGSSPNHADAVQHVLYTSNEMGLQIRDDGDNDPSADLRVQVLRPGVSYEFMYGNGTGTSSSSNELTGGAGGTPLRQALIRSGSRTLVLTCAFFSAPMDFRLRCLAVRS
jgi:hypothetical protein